MIQGAKKAYRFVVEEKRGTVWTRLENVVLDEMKTVRAEIEEGVEVPGMGERVGHVPKDGGNAKCGPYPGSRTIYDYELLPLNSETFVRYTVESVLFSFVLLKFLNGGMGESDDEVTAYATTTP